MLKVAQSSSIYTSAVHALLCMASLFASTKRAHTPPTHPSTMGMYCRDPHPIPSMIAPLSTWNRKLGAFLTSCHRPNGVFRSFLGLVGGVGWGCGAYAAPAPFSESCELGGTSVGVEHIENRVIQSKHYLNCQSARPGSSRSQRLRRLHLVCQRPLL